MNISVSQESNASGGSEIIVGFINPAQSDDDSDATEDLNASEDTQRVPMSGSETEDETGGGVVVMQGSPRQQAQSPDLIGSEVDSDATEDMDIVNQDTEEFDADDEEVPTRPASPIPPSNDEADPASGNESAASQERPQAPGGSAVMAEQPAGGIIGASNHAINNQTSSFNQLLQEQWIQPERGGQPAGPSTNDTPSHGAGDRNGLPNHLTSSVTKRLDTSLNEFCSPRKRKRIDSPKKTVNNEPEVDEDAECCPICFEQWSNSGEHRLVSLKCGHLFGQSCINRWLKGQGGKCPQCNVKANKKDVRVIYAKALRAIDTSERDRAKADLEKEKVARRKAEMEAAQLRLNYQMIVDERNKLQRDLEREHQQLTMLRARAPGSPANSPSKIMGSQLSQSGHRYVFDRIIKIHEAGDCRVMAYCPTLGQLVVSQPSANNLFPGHGVKKINALDMRTSQYVSIHSKHIRDMAFNSSQNNGLLLTCSVDKTVKITSLITNNVLQSYQCPNPLWSCTWNTDDRNYFFAGQTSGTVMMFDIRNTQCHVSQLNTEGIRAPTISLQYVKKNPHHTFRPGGLLVSQQLRATFYEAKSDREFTPHPLPIEGTLTYLSLEEQTRHVLTSYRHPKVKHTMCELSASNVSMDPAAPPVNMCSLNTVQTLYGGPSQNKLARSRLVQHPGGNGRLLVCAGDDTTGSVQIWDASSGAVMQKLFLQADTMDICPMNINDNHYLAILTEKNVRLFKWT